jgi:cytochrome c oxidase subunit 2
MAGASSYSGLVDKTFWMILGSSVLLLLGITVTMIIFIVKYRHSKNSEPKDIEGSATLETLWTVLPTVLVMVMFYYGWAGFKVMRDTPAGAIPVTVQARMWSWSFRYENGKQSTELYVPVGRPVAVKLESADVIHSFFVPAFRLKEDCVPGRNNHAWFQAEREGVYDILCAEYCGDQHSTMLGKVVAVPADTFDVWLERGGGRPTGAKLLQLKGCVACHTSDGSKLVGPSYKGLYGRVERVITDGVEREIKVDDEYLRRSLLQPNADVVVGYRPQMPTMGDQLDDEDIQLIIDYIKRQ